MSEEKLKMITKDILLGLQSIAKGDLESIILYGSYARGDYDQESDLDIAVLPLKADGGFKQCFNDVLGFRLHFDEYPSEFPEYFRLWCDEDYLFNI